LYFYFPSVPGEAQLQALITLAAPLVTRMRLEKLSTTLSRLAALCSQHAPLTSSCDPYSAFSSQDSGSISTSTSIQSSPGCPVASVSGVGGVGVKFRHFPGRK